MLHCAEYFEQEHLIQFVLVSTILRPMAEDVLYRWPRLEGHFQTKSHNTIRRLTSFARTLLRRPDLAYKVRRLDIVTAEYDKDSSELYVKSDEEDNATRVIQHIGQQSAQRSARVEDWQDRLWVGDGNAWAGLILALVPRLQYLDIALLTRDGLWHLDDWDGERYAHSALKKPFGFISPSAFPEAMLPVQLEHIPGLQHLGVLRLFAKDLDTNWCLLPKLFYSTSPENACVRIFFMIAQMA
jgi:hypothetical protein